MCYSEELMNQFFGNGEMYIFHMKSGVTIYGYIVEVQSGILYLYLDSGMEVVYRHVSDEELMTETEIPLKDIDIDSLAYFDPKKKAPVYFKDWARERQA